MTAAVLFAWLAVLVVGAYQPVTASDLDGASDFSVFPWKFSSTKCSNDLCKWLAWSMRLELSDETTHYSATNISRGWEGISGPAAQNIHDFFSWRKLILSRLFIASVPCKLMIINLVPRLFHLTAPRPLGGGGREMKEPGNEVGW